MDDYLLVEAGLNIQKFEKNRKFNLNDHPEIIEALDIFPNGEIMGIKRSAVESALNEVEVDNIRNGLKERPKEMKVESPEDFMRVIAIYIDIEEY